MLIADRRGIVATITGVLAERGIHLLELNQTVVHDYFTITVAVSVPRAEQEVGLTEEIRKRLGGDASVTLIPYLKASHRASNNAVKCDRYILTATGEAETEVVHALTELIAERGGNFVDFSFENTDGTTTFIAEIDLPTNAPVGALQVDLVAVGHTAKNLSVRLQHQLLFTATNDIAFRRVGS